MSHSTFFVLCHTRKRLSSVEKTTAVLKKAMAEKSEKCKSRDWCGTAKTRWQQPVGRQSSHDAWEHAKPKGKWKEVSAEFDAVGAVVKEKKNTWHKSGKESSKRETELYSMVESAATDEKQEERDRCRIRARGRNRKDEEEEARCLFEEMQRNLDAAQKKVVRQNESCAAFCGNTLKLVTKNEDDRKL